MKPEIYTPAGWVNIPWIASRPTWLKVIIGARQVGKTYGTLLYHVSNKIPHILLRRTTNELKFIGGNSLLDPYGAIAPAGYNYRLFAGANGFYTIAQHDADGKQIAGSTLGLAMSLPQVANVRGFNGSQFESVILDEAVPEKGVRVLRAEGDQLLNAYTTISGNRELNGKPPLTLWLLSNTNNINSPILDALNLMDDIIMMQNKGREYMEHDGVSIFFGRSEAITTERRKTVLARRVRSDSAFAQMAYDNTWAYDDSPLIGQRPLRSLTPLCSYDNRLFLWEGSDFIYVCAAKHKVDAYTNNDFDRARFRADYRWLVQWYANAMITFSNIKLLAIFKRLFDLDY